ncbi:MAG: lipopolysaccharide transport periplasmic protein LptA [Burkholderiales bacterium]|nr:lipopolysaccharide transport periplasmic protein LptA [Burkholderiales bacterium]
MNPAAPVAPKQLVRALILCIGLAGALAAQAERADRFKPLNFVADSARADDARQVNILTGDVDITKGTMILRAQRVEVRQNTNGTQNAVATGGSAGRAYFRQKREGLDEYIEGESERIEYDGATDVIRFTGRAVMRRLRGAAVADEVVGQTITYNNTTDVFQVAGGPDSAAPGGRVRGVISPKPGSDAAGSQP